MIGEAQGHLEARRYEQVIAIYQKLVERFPAEDSYLLQLAWACHDAGRVTESLACFEQLLEKELRQDIFTGFAYDELVRIFKAEGLYDRLIGVCEKAVYDQPEDTGYLGDLGDALIRAGRFDRAAEVFGLMIAIDPDEADFHCRLGNALIRAGDFSAGQKAYEAAAGMDPAAADRFYDRLARVYHEAGQDEQAEAAQRKSVAQCPEKAVYHLNLCEILVHRRKFSDARHACEQAIAISPAEGAVCYNRLGNTLLRAGCHREAMDIFLQALSLDAGNPRYYRHLAECARALGLDLEAETYLRLAQNGP